MDTGIACYGLGLSSLSVLVAPGTLEALNRGSAPSQAGVQPLLVDFDAAKQAERAFPLRTIRFVEDPSNSEPFVVLQTSPSYRQVKSITGDRTRL